MRLGYEKCLLFSVVRLNKMDVSDKESKQELSKLTPPDNVNEVKTVTTADLLPEKSKQLYGMRNAKICLWNCARNCKNF
jgi:ribosomal protein S19E (S16A)